MTPATRRHLKYVARWYRDVMHLSIRGAILAAFREKEVTQ